MAITSWPLVNKLSGTGTAGSLGTFPIYVGAITLPPYGALPVVNKYGVSLGSAAGATTGYAI